MTLKQWQAKLDRSVKNLKNFTEPLRIAAYTATAQMGERIFDEGRTTEGTTIGKYSEEPIYVSMAAVPKPKDQPTGKPSGKTRKKKITEVQSVLDEFGDEVNRTGRTTKRVVIGTETVAVGGRSVFASGKKKGEKHKSKYFAQGYKGYRDNVERQTAKVDLSLTGELRLDFGNQKEEAIPRKISDFEYQIQLNKEIDQKKREGAEEKYGTIFSLSDTEKSEFVRVAQFEFNNRISKALGK